MGRENQEKAVEVSKTGAYFYSLWHQNTVAGMIGQWGGPYQILLSGSKDGDLLKFTADRMGYTSVRGSSTRGGKKAMDELIIGLKAGKSAAITPDGPLGPPKVVKSGIIEMARKSGASILPLSTVANSYWTFNSWDQFRLPRPFSKIIVRYGKPITVDPDTPFESFDSIKEEISKEMNYCESLLEQDLEQW